MNIENLLNTDKRHTLITQKSILPMVDLIVVIGICFFYFFCEGGELYAKSKSRMDTRYS